MEMKKEKKMKKGGVGCKKGGCCVLSTSTCGLGYQLELPNFYPLQALPVQGKQDQKGLIIILDQTTKYKG
jgi:hypothetical protein